MARCWMAFQYSLPRDPEQNSAAPTPSPHGWRAATAALKGLVDSAR